MEPWGTPHLMFVSLDALELFFKILLINGRFALANHRCLEHYMASLKTTILFVFRKKVSNLKFQHYIEQFLFDAFNSFNSR